MRVHLAGERSHTAGSGQRRSCGRHRLRRQRGVVTRVATISRCARRRCLHGAVSQTRERQCCWAGIGLRFHLCSSSLSASLGAVELGRWAFASLHRCPLHSLVLVLDCRDRTRSTGIQSGAVHVSGRPQSPYRPTCAWWATSAPYVYCRRNPFASSSVAAQTYGVRRWELLRSFPSCYDIPVVESVFSVGEFPVSSVGRW